VRCCWDTVRPCNGPFWGSSGERLENARRCRYSLAAMITSLVTGLPDAASKRC
jgi:hypothetical protein